MAQRPMPRGYTVGWIWVLGTELAAAQEMLNEEHEDLERTIHDDNLYSPRSIAGYHVAIVLPASWPHMQQPISVGRIPDAGSVRKPTGRANGRHWRRRAERRGGCSTWKRRG